MLCAMSASEEEEHNSGEVPRAESPVPADLQELGERGEDKRSFKLKDIRTLKPRVREPVRQDGGGADIEQPQQSVDPWLLAGTSMNRVLMRVGGSNVWLSIRRVEKSHNPPPNECVFSDPSPFEMSPLSTSCAIGVCLYNEQANEMIRTLGMLRDSSEHHDSRRKALVRALQELKREETQRRVQNNKRKKEWEKAKKRAYYALATNQLQLPAEEIARRESRIASVDSHPYSGVEGEHPHSRLLHREEAELVENGDAAEWDHVQVEDPVVDRNEYLDILGVMSPPGDEQPLRSLQMTKEQLERELYHAKWKGQAGLPPDILQHFCLVQDGWANSSETMRKYLAIMFSQQDREEELFSDLRKGSSEYQRDWTTWIPLKDGHEEKKENLDKATYIIEYVTERRSDRGTFLGYQAIKAPHGPMKGQLVTLIVKGGNRRKHNSHRWFFDSYCKARNPCFTFTTDAGTGFHPKCMAKLYKYMQDESNSEVMGVTGRQRVMTAEMQETDDGLVDWFLRLVQSADYESSYAITTGAYTLVGMLPVLPGPCALLRYEEVKDTVLPYYFKVAEAHIQDTGMVLGNLKIAEDRIVSYGLVLQHDQPSKTHWVPGAVFYFQAETDMEVFIAQRRRWLNGTLSGYLYLAIHKMSILCYANNVSPARRVLIWFLIMLQLLSFLITFMTPAITLIGLNFALPYCFHHDSVLNNFVFYFSVLWWIFFGAVHYFLSSKAKFNVATFVVLFLINTFGMILNTYAFISFYLDHPLDAIFWVVIGMIGLPYVIALIHLDIVSFLYLLRAAIPYYLFLPTFIGGFIVYAAARTWDLTWGNRATNAETLFERREAADEASKAKEEQDHADFIKKLRILTLGSLLTILILNVLVVVLLNKYKVHSGFLIVVLATIFGTTIIQATFSVTFFITHHFRSIRQCLYKVVCICLYLREKKERAARHKLIQMQREVLEGGRNAGPSVSFDEEYQGPPSSLRHSRPPRDGVTGGSVSSSSVAGSSGLIQEEEELG